MISSRDAKKKASAIAVPKPGDVITIKGIEVFCAWMQMNNLKKVQWRGNMLEVTPVNRIEHKDKEENHV